MKFNKIFIEKDLEKVKSKLIPCKELQGVSFDYDGENNQVIILSFYDVDDENSYLDHIHKIQVRIKNLLGVDIDPTDYDYDGGMDWVIPHHELKKLKEVIK